MEATLKKTKKEPLFHVVKKTNLSLTKKILIRVIAVFLAFLLSAMFLWISEGCDPVTFFVSLFTGVFGTERRIWISLKDVAILLGLGLALLPCFRMKFWNTGADGQALMGALAAYAVVFFLKGKVAEPLILIIALVCAVAAGLIFAIIPGICKALWNTNETLFTLMLNYVAIQIVSWFTCKFATSQSNTLEVLSSDGVLPKVYNQFLLPILIITVLLVIIGIYVNKTKHGYELSVVGESQPTARYVGINSKRVIIRTCALSGAICGLIGFILTCGLNHSVTTETLNGLGFTAIIVCWLANFNPYYMILTSFMVVFLNNGMSTGVLPAINGTNEAITDIIIPIFFVFIIGCTFFATYKIMVRHNDDGEIDNKFLNKCYVFLHKNKKIKPVENKTVSTKDNTKEGK